MLSYLSEFQKLLFIMLSIHGFVIFLLGSLFLFVAVLGIYNKNNLCRCLFTVSSVWW